MDFLAKVALSTLVAVSLLVAETLAPDTRK